MRTALILLLAVLAAPAFADPPSASSDASPAVVDAAAFFHLGELYEAHTWQSYYEIAGAKIPERLAAFEAECRRLGATKEVMDDLIAFNKRRLAMPFLTKPYAAWTPEEQKEWGQAPTFRDDLWKAWLDKPDYEPRFFWHLGRTSMQGWFVYGRDVLERGVDYRTWERGLRELIRTASVIQSDPGYTTARARLTPEAAAALKGIADLLPQIDDPFGEGLTLERVKAVDLHCRRLRDLGRAKNLTAAPKAGAS